MQDDTTPINPLVAVRIARGISRKALAHVIGKGYSSVAAAEVGNLVRLPEAWRPGLEALNVDFDALQSAYAEWRQADAAAAVARTGA